MFVATPVMIRRRAPIASSNTSSVVEWNPECFGLSTKVSSRRGCSSSAMGFPFDRRQCATIAAKSERHLPKLSFT